MDLVRAAIASEDLEATMRAVEALLAEDPNNLDALMIKASYLRRRGNGTQAQEVYRRILEIDPDNVPALVDSTLVALGEDRHALAAANVDRLDEINPAAPIAGYLRGLVALHEDQAILGIRLAKEALAKMPEERRVELLSGVLETTGGDLKLGEDYLSEILERLPDSVVTRKLLAEVRLKRLDAEGALEALSAIPESARDAEVMAMTGSAHLLRHDTSQGIDWLHRALDAQPGATELRMQLARALLSVKDPKDAVEVLSGQDRTSGLDTDLEGLLVVALVAAGDVQEALRIAERLESATPRNAIALDLAGHAYLAAGDLDGAVARFEQATAINPDYTPAHVHLAQADVAAGRPDHAQQRLEQLNRRIQSLGVQLELARLAEARGDDEAERGWLQDAHSTFTQSIEPGLRLVRHLAERQKIAKALEVIHELEERAPASAQVARLKAAITALSEDPFKAIPLYREQLAEHPDDWETLFLLASAQWKAGDLAGARASLEHCIEINSANPWPRLSLASLELQAGNQKAALALARGIQQDFPEWIEGYVVEAAVEDIAGRPGQAADAYIKAYPLPGGKGITVKLAEALYRAGRLDEAIDYLTIQTQRHPEDTKAQLLLALAYQASGNDERALAQYELVIARAPNHVDALNNLAWLYRKNHDNQRAWETAGQAYELAPDDPAVADTYGWSLLAIGKTSEALDVLGRAHAESPDSTTIAYHLAVASLRAGDERSAKRLLTRVVEIDPDGPEADDARDLLDSIHHSAP